MAAATDRQVLSEHVFPSHLVDEVSWTSHRAAEMIKSLEHEGFDCQAFLARHAERYDRHLWHAENAKVLGGERSGGGKFEVEVTYLDKLSWMASHYERLVVVDVKEARLVLTNRDLLTLFHPHPISRPELREFRRRATVEAVPALLDEIMRFEISERFADNGLDLEKCC